MPVRTFTASTDLLRCTYDHHMEIVDGNARLKSRLLVADDSGAVTSRTHEILAGDIQIKKTFMLGFADVNDAELAIRI